MPLYTARQVQDILGAAAQLPMPDAAIIEPAYDTRRIRNAETCLFFAIVGARDGHNYIDEAYQAGIRNFVVSKPLQSSNLADANIFTVTDTLAALQQLAAQHRNTFNIPVIGITGSNGKTIVKEWLYHLLKQQYHVVRSPKSYNSQLGVPLSVWNMEKEHTLGIFEAGISTIGEMRRLEKVIQPTVGIFTNLGDAHNEGFESKAQKAAEKAKLFKNSQAIVFCYDHKEVRNAIAKELAGKRPYSWSMEEAKHPIFVEVKKLPRQCHITLTIDKKYDFSIPFTDDASVEDAVHCAVTLHALGLDINRFANLFRELLPVEMRLQLKKGLRNCDIINDSYNADLNSLGIALDSLTAQKQHQKKVVILSDITQSGLSSSELYRQVAHMLKEKNVSFFIGIGPAISANKEKFSVPAEFFDNTENFLEHFMFSSLSDAAILVKGARHFAFENIIHRLEEKMHETVLEVNLSALLANLRYYRSLLKTGTGLMAMVKAYSYGSGSYEVANLLQFHGADYLAVAYPDEGTELRKKGISTPIMVMNPAPGSFDEMLEYYLEPEIYNFSILQDFINAFEKSAQAEAKIHLEFDTGMHRLGFEEKDIEQIIETLKKYPEIKIASVFSHLSASDEDKYDEFTQLQVDKFTRIKEKISAAFGYKILFHICNSSGITRFPNAHFDMVRLGIGLYGIDAGGTDQQNLQNVFRLKTIVSQIREIAPNESVGYARKAIDSKPRRIAVAAIGYADGLRRELSNGKGKLKINGKWAPITGNVCMDMCMADVTDIDCREGDDAIIFETNDEILQLAKKMNTIPYEVLTGISQRVKRVYWQE